MKQLAEAVAIGGVIGLALFAIGGALWLRYGGETAVDHLVHF